MEFYLANVTAKTNSIANRTAIPKVHSRKSPIKVNTAAVLFKKKVCPFSWEGGVFQSPTQRMVILAFSIEGQTVASLSKILYK